MSRQQPSRGRASAGGSTARGCGVRPRAASGRTRPRWRRRWRRPPPGCRSRGPRTSAAAARSPRRRPRSCPWPLTLHTPCIAFQPTRTISPLRTRASQSHVSVSTLTRSYWFLQKIQRSNLYKNNIKKHRPGQKRQSIKIIVVVSKDVEDIDTLPIWLGDTARTTLDTAAISDNRALSGVSQPNRDFYCH